jgi:hypothetical protein
MKQPKRHSRRDSPHTAEPVIDFPPNGPPTPEIIEARREVREEAAQLVDWKRYQADAEYRQQMDELPKRTPASSCVALKMRPVSEIYFCTG